jgi:hypothetical protein
LLGVQRRARLADREREVYVLLLLLVLFGCVVVQALWL